jgi:hypothetical protein
MCGSGGRVGMTDVVYTGWRIVGMLAFADHKVE